MEKQFVTVGIPTDGEPRLRREEGITVLENQLIGVGFHWERAVESRLPGEIMVNDDPLFRLINRLPVEDYLEAVVGSEMNPSAPVEFLKAHAIISRSWVMGKILRCHNAGEHRKVASPVRIVDWEDTCDHIGFDVCADDHCQRYQGIQDISDNPRRAIKETEGLVIVSERGELVDARFSKCCGGITEMFSTCWQDVEPDCLESVEDKWCDLSGLPEDEKKRLLGIVMKDYDLSLGGGYRWKRRVSKRGIGERVLSRIGMDLGNIKSFNPMERGVSGRIKLLRIVGEKGEIEIGKELLIRRIMAPDCLYSSAFEIEEAGDDLILHGKGWGHGVGLCQIGAAHMAAHGYTVREILAHYYPGSRLSSSFSIP